MQAPDFALEHQDARLSLALAADAHLSGLWDRVDPDDIVLSWLAQLPEATLALSGAQFAAANLAEGYLADSAVAEGISELPEAEAIPRAFAGVASDGRQLASLLAQPAVGALGAIQSGHDPRRALAMGRSSLSMIAQTQVADAGRGADQVALAGYRQLRGYVRVVQGSACSRCIILAGRIYGWSSGFKRHPNCHCVMLPVARAEAAGIKQTPQQLYSLLTSAERRAAGWSLAEQEALDAGADIFQVTNARQGMYTAGGRRFTTVGTSRRAIYGGYDIDPDTGELTKRPRGARRKPPRVTVDQIFAEAGNRDDALRMLRRYGYLRENATAVREGSALARPMAAEALDPALKFTVAALKQLAKDHGVRIVGITKKHDLIYAIRQWESDKLKSGGRKLLPDGPIGKPITFKPQVIEAPPLGVPPKDPVLSGGVLNDWADYFRHDREQGRFQFVDARGNTPPEGVRVRNLRVSFEGTGYQYFVIDGTAWSFDGVAYLVEHGADQFGSPWVSRTLADLRRAHEEIPAAKLANKSYAALGGDNPADDYWRRKYNNPEHTSAASASRGHIKLWNFRAPYSRVDIERVLRHETGHNLDDLIGRTIGGSESQAWQAAAKTDVKASAKVKDLSGEAGHGGFGKVEAGRDFPNGVTAYGRSSAAEDFAESVQLYQLGPIAQGRLAAGAEIGPIYFRDLYPARAKILDKLFPDLAKAQKAEIKALRAPKPAAVPAPGDLSKLKVPELRALAKERGLTGYSKLTKPQLLERLGGHASIAPEKGTKVAPARRVGGVPKIEPFRGVPQDELDRAYELLDQRTLAAAFARQLFRSDLSQEFRSAANLKWLKQFQSKYPGALEHIRQNKAIDLRFEAWRAERRFAESAGQLKRSVEAQMRRQLSDAPIIVRRARESSLRDILDHGRLKTQFETGQSGGTFAPGERAQFEGLTWGYAEKLDVRLRPIYGYIAPGGVEAETARWPVAQYGPIRIVLRSSVRSRTSFTFGDSLTADVVPSALNSPNWRSFDYFYGSHLDDFGSEQFQSFTRYIEAQVHGGVNVADIAEVIFSAQPEAATIASLKAAGVPWRVIKPII